MTNILSTNNGMTNWMGFGVSVPYIRVELTNKENGQQYKQICYTQEELDRVHERQATPGDIFYGCHMSLIHCVPESTSDLAV